MREVADETSRLLEQSNIVVVVPAYNEERNIGKVIQTMPAFVDHIVVVDDCSTDATVAVVERHIPDPRVVLIRHDQNQGVGGAIASGYEWARDHDADAAVVMAGDAQMDPDDLPRLILPVLRCDAHYAKGNRLIFRESIKLIPAIRFWGNSMLSFLTKIASGYWHVSDSQCGYTAIHKDALKAIDWRRMYKRYGQPNDLLVTLNIYSFTVKDVPVRPVYNVGEVSGMRVHKAALTISVLLLKKFIRRMVLKYVVLDFHPLVLFYVIGFVLFIVSLILLLRIVVVWIADGYAPPMTAIAFMFAATTSLHSFFFAMWMDMETNKSLRR